MAKSKPGSFTFASSGIGGGASIYGALVNNVTGIKMLEVPYKSLGAGITDLIAGQILVAFDLFPAVSPHIESGKLRALAVTQARRLSALPDIPTVAESGFPGIEMTLFGGILVVLARHRPLSSCCTSTWRRLLMRQITRR